jgi:hypothetical protein
MTRMNVRLRREKRPHVEIAAWVTSILAGTYYTTCRGGMFGKLIGP